MLVPIHLFCLNFNKHEHNSMCVGSIVFCQQHFSPKACRGPRRLCHHAASGVWESADSVELLANLFVVQGKEESPLHSDNGNKHFSVEEVVWT